MTGAEILRRDAVALAEAVGLTAAVIEDEGRLYVRIDDFSLPPGWSVPTTPILVLADSQYPQSALDMFWCDPAVVGPNSTVPRNADTMETYLGQQWRRFSWHGGNAGAPPANPLLAHFAMIEERFVMETRS